MIMSSKNLLENVEKALEEIRPFLQNDGGNINLIGIENETVVKVQLIGACSTCTVNQMTFKIEKACLKNRKQSRWSSTDNKDVCLDHFKLQY